jgi:hypothetical protein
MGRWRPTQAELVTPPAVADPELWSERQRRRESEANRDRQTRQQRRTRPAARYRLGTHRLRSRSGCARLPRPRESAGFLGGSGGTAAESLHPQTTWRRRQSGANPSLAGRVPDQQGRYREIFRTRADWRGPLAGVKPVVDRAERISLDPGTGKLGSGIRATPRPSTQRARTTVGRGSSPIAPRG